MFRQKFVIFSSDKELRKFTWYRSTQTIENRFFFLLICELFDSEPSNILHPREDLVYKCFFLFLMEQRYISSREFLYEKKNKKKQKHNETNYTEI